MYFDEKKGMRKGQRRNDSPVADFFKKVSGDRWLGLKGIFLASVRANVKRAEAKGFKGNLRGEGSLPAVRKTAIHDSNWQVVCLVVCW